MSQNLTGYVDSIIKKVFLLVVKHGNYPHNKDKRIQWNESGIDDDGKFN